MDVYTHVHMYLYMYVCTCTYVYTSIHMSCNRDSILCVYVHICVCLKRLYSLYIYVHTCVFLWTHFLSLCVYTWSLKRERYIHTQESPYMSFVETFSLERLCIHTRLHIQTIQSLKKVYIYMSVHVCIDMQKVLTHRSVFYSRGYRLEH